MPRNHIATTAVLLAALSNIPSCKAGAQDAGSTVQAYSPGRWRQASRQELESTLVWVSHILIRHRDLRVQSVNFAPPDWRLSVAPASRTREQARTLALEISRELKSSPDEFTAYAQRYSEDLATQADGGSLGGRSASSLSSWPQLLDALSAIEAGEISDPVETEYGFHILLERKPPPEDIVTGAHVVIGYDDARWLHDMLARGEVPKRSREEALALANGLYERARLHPEQFLALVEQYSEHRDAARGGDLGTWSTREEALYPREMEALQGREVGSVAPPIDSMVGFQVLMRVPNPPRKDYAMTAIALLFDASAPEASASSRQAVSRKAQMLADLAAREPARFDELRALNCCTDVLSWREGPEFAEVGPVLDELEFGEIAKTPVETIGQIVVPRRLDPALLAKRTFRLGLP
jgi:hypothetical protein